MTKSTAPLIPVESIQQLILLIREEKVIIDADLALLYGVSTRRLNEQVKRNVERFPEDFVFQLTKVEADSLRSHFATLKTGRGRHRKYLPYVFTEHGTLMAASVLNTPRAVAVSVYVVRAFVKLREMLSTQKKLAERFAELENKLTTHDQQIQTILAAIRQLMNPPAPPKRRIGFHEGEES